MLKHGIAHAGEAAAGWIVYVRPTPLGCRSHGRSGMTDTAKPLLLIDVDGVLNPYPLLTKNGHLPPKARKGETSFAYAKHKLWPEQWIGTRALPVLLSKEHGKHLAALSELYDLVWATTWENEANRLLAPILDLPELPVIEWPAGAKEWIWRTPQHLGSWKTKHIAEWLDKNAPGAPWVWVDDDLTKHDRAWLREHYGHDKKEDPPVPYWLFRVEPRHGLREQDFLDLRTWGRDPHARPTGIRAV